MDLWGSPENFVFHLFSSIANQNNMISSGSSGGTYRPPLTQAEGQKWHRKTEERLEATQAATPREPDGASEPLTQFPQIMVQSPSHMYVFVFFDFLVCTVIVCQLPSPPFVITIRSTLCSLGRIQFLAH